MLHAVAARVGQIVGQESVTAGFVGRVFPKDGALDADDLLDILDEAIEFASGSQMVDSKSKRVTVNVELFHRSGTEFRWAVHQVLEIRRGEFKRVRAGMELRGNLPPGIRRRHKSQRQG